MSRYYYAPIDPGYGQMAASIMGGIQSGLANVQQHREQQFQRQRQQKADQRAETLFDVQIDQAGYRHGQAPTDRWAPQGLDSLAGALAPPEATAPGDPFRGIGAGLGLGAPQSGGTQPALPGMGGVDLFSGAPRPDLTPRSADSFAVNLPREGMRQVSDNLYFDESASPEGRRAQAQLEAMRQESAFEEARRSQLEEAIFEALEGRADITPERRRAMARVASYDSGMLDDLLPPDAMGRPPVRGTPEYMRMLEQEEAIRARFRPRSTASDNRRPMTMGQAADYVRSIYSDPETGELLIPYQQFDRIVRDVASGEDYMLPPIPEKEGGGRRRGLWDRITPWNTFNEQMMLEEAGGGRSRGGDAGDDFDLFPGDAAVGFGGGDDEQMQELVREMRGLTAQQAEEVLREAGADAATIRRFRQARTEADRTRR